MKILELRFKNLNSLYGEWLIDFTTADYASNGIFALIGPTGAGKSTVLDAICLALYGATPRLGRITKSGNEIMSRQTGECYAEVTFESQAGTFRCHWSQHRARKKADGKLAESKHEIADALSGQLLEAKKKKDVASVIEEKTGMDFDRFTRSILLAQGGFDTFLKADVEQKSKILEQITGTEIYSEISRRVHERQRDERDKLNLLQAEISGIGILTEQQETGISKDLTEKKESETKTAAKFQSTEKAIAWLTAINDLRNEIVVLSQESEKLNITLDKFKPDRERLSRALKAAELEARYATLSGVRHQQDTDHKLLKEEQKQLPNIEASVSEKEHQLKELVVVMLKAKEEQKIQEPVIQKVRLLDQQISDRRKSINTDEIDCKNATEQIAVNKRLLQQTRVKLETAEKELQLVHNYLQENSHDELLVSQLAGIEQQLNNLVSVQQDNSGIKLSLAEAEIHLKSAVKTVDLDAGKLTLCQKKLDNEHQQLVLKKGELKELLGHQLVREYRTQKETLLREMAFLNKISDLESERNKLEDNKPCPLCGAQEHPYAQGNIPQADKTEKQIISLTELIEKAEQLELNIKALEVSEKDLLAKVTATEKLTIKTLNEKENADKALKNISTELAKNNELCAQLKSTALRKLQAIGIEGISDSDVTSLISSLQIRLGNWQEQQRKKEQIENQSSEFNSELKELDAIIETQEQTLTEKHNILNRLKKEYEDQSAERTKLFGSKKTETEAVRLEKAVSDAEQLEKTDRTEWDKAKQLLNSAKVRIGSLQERISQTVSELQSLENDFISALCATGFSDESSFIANCLSASEREQLTDRAKELDNKATDLQARIKDREIRLAQEVDKKITVSPLQELQPEYKELEVFLKQLRDDIAGLKHQLNDNNSAKEKLKEKQGEIDRQKNECSRWGKLHGLIGSADGKKYRNFAQGLTFELMVSHANRQLEKMTDRYLLIRDNEQPLELNVIDNYQAGEIRSTKNLSGGESFIVSLTLALGLSKMASHKVRVDSLYLDEGFGTLDEESLETALETLAGLQQDGKLIGIISHVSALKERISTQINVLPLSAGKSTISGPGCEKIMREAG